MTFRKGRFYASTQLEHSTVDLSCKVVPRLDFGKDFLLSCGASARQSPGAAYPAQHLPERPPQSCQHVLTARVGAWLLTRLHVKMSACSPDLLFGGDVLAVGTCHVPREGLGGKNALALLQS